ncbi:hypothetical protein AB0B07_33130 [Streptomyces sioyaensis]|uniref:hypothetical protein n=1 Tax=Streptomyces sioyaensis TaxID=67364 RepID=UPI0033D8D38C
MNKDRTATDIRPRRTRTVGQPDEFLYQARNPRRSAPPAEPSAEVRRLATALEGMTRHALPHIDDNEQPVVRVDVADPTNGADALTLCLPRQIADLLVLAAATIGEQYRDKPVTPARPALHAIAGGAR